MRGIVTSMFLYRRVARLVALSFVSVGALACGTAAEPTPEPPAGALVVGVQAEDQLGIALGPVHLVVKVDGAVASDQTLTIDKLPKEVPLGGTPGAEVDVEVTGMPTAGGGPAAVTRLARAHVVAAPDGVKKKLLRVMLEQRCTSFAAPGSTAPPPVQCAAAQTCIAGKCASADVPDAQLEDYDPGWASAPPDVCRPAQHGPPEVVVGTGQTDFAPLTDGQTMQMELGPQGGHHVWIATRMRNLRRSGSTTTIRARVLDAPDAVAPVAYVFTYDPDEGSYCKLYGLRFQLDSGAQDLKNAYRAFLGKTIEVTATVTDSTKATASGKTTIKLGDTLICPDGTQSCNL